MGSRPSGQCLITVTLLPSTLTSVSGQIEGTPACFARLSRYARMDLASPFNASASDWETQRDCVTLLPAMLTVCSQLPGRMRSAASAEAAAQVVTTATVMEQKRRFIVGV